MSDLHLLYFGPHSETLELFKHHTSNITAVEEEEEVFAALSHGTFDGIIVENLEEMRKPLKLLEQIKAIKKHLLMVIITAHPDQESLLRAISLGITDVLIAPFEAKKVAEITKKLHFTSLMNHQLLQKNLLLNQYKNALDSSLIISKTDTSGAITYVNDKFCHITGYYPGEIIGKTHRLFKHPETSKEQMRQLWQTIQSKRIWHGTIVNQTKKEETFYTDTFIVPILDDKNEIVEYMDMRIDITEIKNYLNIIQKKVDEATQAIYAQQQQLIAQSRAAALGEMFDNIAHQWRQPIGAINNAIINAEFALELGNIDEEEIFKTFENISSYTAFLSKTIDDFRNFSNPDKEKTLFTLHESILQTLGIIQGAYEMNRITLSYDPDPQLRILQVYGPMGELSQVLLNILSNARDAIKEKQISGNIRIDLSATEDAITITLADNAGGIPESVLPKIFDPYFTTKNKAQGTGIGLYMSKTIIEKHYEGKIEVYNEEDGAVFLITLPIARKE